MPPNEILNNPRSPIAQEIDLWRYEILGLPPESLACFLFQDIMALPVPDGERIMVAIFGTRGSGKTSAINRVNAIQTDDETIFIIGLDAYFEGKNYSYKKRNKPRNDYERRALWDILQENLAVQEIQETMTDIQNGGDIWFRYTDQDPVTLLFTSYPSVKTNPPNRIAWEGIKLPLLHDYDFTKNYYFYARWADVVTRSLRRHSNEPTRYREFEILKAAFYWQQVGMKHVVPQLDKTATIVFDVSSEPFDAKELKKQYKPILLPDGSEIWAKNCGNNKLIIANRTPEGKLQYLRVPNLPWETFLHHLDHLWLIPELVNRGDEFLPKPQIL